LDLTLHPKEVLTLEFVLSEGGNHVPVTLR